MFCRKDFAYPILSNKDLDKGVDPVRAGFGRKFQVPLMKDYGHF